MLDEAKKNANEAIYFMEEGDINTALSHLAKASSLLVRARKEAKISDLKVGGLNRDSLIENLMLSTRSLNCLRNDGVMTIEHLVQYSEEELLRVPNIGRKCLQEIKESLAVIGANIRQSKEQ